MVPKLLPTSHNLPRGLSLKAQFSYGVVSPSGPGFTQVVPRTTSLLEAARGRAQSHERDPAHDVLF